MSYRHCVSLVCLAPLATLVACDAPAEAPSPSAPASAMGALTATVPGTSGIAACSGAGGGLDGATLCAGEDWWLPSPVSGTRSPLGRIYVNGFAETDGVRDAYQDGDKHDMAGHGHMWRPYWGEALERNETSGIIDWSSDVRTMLFNYRERFCTSNQASESSDPDQIDKLRRAQIALLPPVLAYGASTLTPCTSGGFCTAKPSYCTDEALADWDIDHLYVTLSGSLNGAGSPRFMSSLLAEAGATALPTFMARRFLDDCTEASHLATCGARLVADPATPTRSLLASAVARLEAGGAPCASDVADCKNASVTYLDCKDGKWSDCSVAQAYLVQILHTYGMATGTVDLSAPDAARQQAALVLPTYDYSDPNYAATRATYLRRWAELLQAEGRVRARGVNLAAGMSYSSLQYGESVIGSIDLDAESGLVPFEARTFLGQADVDTGLDGLIGAAVSASAATGLPVGTWNLAISQGGNEFAHAIQTAWDAGVGLAAHSAITMFSYDFMQFVPSQSYDRTYQAYRPTRTPSGGRVALGWSNLHTDIEAWENTANSWGEYRWLRASALAAVAAGFTSLTLGGCGLPSEGRWSQFETGAAGENKYAACLANWADIQAHGAEGFFDWLVATVGRTGADSNEATCNLFQSGIPVAADDASFFDRDLETNDGLPATADAVGQLAANHEGWQRTPRVTHWGQNCTLDMTNSAAAPVFAMSSAKLGGTQQDGTESVMGIQGYAKTLTGEDACEQDPAGNGKVLCAYEGRTTNAKSDGSGTSEELAFFLADDFLATREGATDATTLASRVWVVKVMFAPLDAKVASNGVWELAYRTRMPGGCLGWGRQAVSFAFDADQADYTTSAYGAQFAGKRGVATATFRLNDAVFAGNAPDASDLVIHHVMGDHASFLTLRVIDAGDCASSDECMTGWQGAVEDEVCDGVDNDCNGQTDDVGPMVFADRDGDGYGDVLSGANKCTVEAGETLVGGDCMDTRPDIHPGASELACTGFDENCDGTVDELKRAVFADIDGDGFGSGSAAMMACDLPSTSYSWRGDDCNDGVQAIHPGGTEICNGRDDNCDGTVDEALPIVTRCYVDGDKDGFGTGSGIPNTQCGCPVGYAAQANDRYPWDARRH